MKPSCMPTDDGVPSGASQDRARALLVEALEIIDRLQKPPEIGARLQHVLDLLDESETTATNGSRKVA